MMECAQWAKRWGHVSTVGWGDEQKEDTGARKICAKINVSNIYPYIVHL